MGNLDAITLEVATLLGDRLGLNLNSISGINLKKVIQQEIQFFGILDAEKYQHKLVENRTIFNHLVDAIIVPETSFFRHPASFEFLHNHFTKSRMHKSSLKVLSIPCSTGEEAYSIGITLLESGFSPQEITITAVDISENSLQKAQAGFYKKYAFRSSSPNLNLDSYLNKYFDRQDDYYYVNSKLRSLISFSQGNLIDATFLATLQNYDIIFCRNVLIYFNEVARIKVIEKLHKALNNEGLLFIGYAETNFIHPNLFQNLRIPHAFVYAKRTTVPKAETPIPHKVAPRALKPSNKKNPAVKQSNNQLNNQAPIKLSPKPQQDEANAQSPLIHHDSTLTAEKLKLIREIANQGNLPRALEECQQYLSQFQTDAEAYLLLGEICQAQNLEEEAEIAFRKAIYLNPHCIESLTYLALLYEQRQNFQQAQRYWQRIQSINNS